MRKIILSLLLVFISNILFAQFNTNALLGLIRSETPLPSQYLSESYTEPGFGLKVGAEAKYEYKAICVGFNLSLCAARYNGNSRFFSSNDGALHVTQFVASPSVAIKPVKAINLYFGFSPVLYVDIQNELIQSPNIPSSGGKYWAGKLFANYEYKRFGVEIAYVKFYDHYYYLLSMTNGSFSKNKLYFSNIELTFKYNFFKYPK